MERSVTSDLVTLWEWERRFADGVRRYRIVQRSGKSRFLLESLSPQDDVYGNPRWMQLEDAFKDEDILCLFDSVREGPRTETKYGRDCGPSFTLGDLVEKFADAMEGGGDSEDDDGKTPKAAVDVIFQEFLDGCYAGNFDLLKANGFDFVSMRRDIAGFVASAYRAGKQRGAQEDR